MSSENPRLIDLYLDVQARQLVQGPQSSAPLQALDLYQGDTYLLRVNGQAPVLDSSLAVYAPVTLSYPTMNAAIVFVGAPPSGGSWEVGYGSDKTAALPFDIASKDLETAVNALAAVTANGGLSFLIIANAPANEFVYQWNTDGATGALTIAANKLSPVCLTEVAAVPQVAGQYLIKLSRAPLALSDNFTNPEPPGVTVEQVVSATSTRNQVQRITVPADAVGQFSLVFNGGGTPLPPVETVAAADISTALNDLYAAPGNFSVTSPATGIFDVQMQGSLAAANQTLIGVEMYDQVPLSSPTANLVIPNVPVDLELLGQEEIPVAFQITAFDADGNKIVLARQTVTLLGDDMTSGTEAQLAQLNAIQYVVRTVYVNQSEGDPVVTAAAGFAYTPSVEEAGATFVINHGLNTLNPRVDVQLQVSAGEWRSMSINAEYYAISTSTSTVSVTFPVALSTDPANAYYVGNIKIFIYSPDQTVMLWVAQILWDNVLQAIPGGEALTAKLAAIDSAIGVIGGNFKLAAGNITGEIEPDQIDLAALANAFASTAAFLNALTSLVTNSAVINAIAGALAGNAIFDSTLSSELANSTVLTSLVNALTTNSAFSTALTTLVNQTLAGGGVGQLPPGTIAFSIPDFTFAYPPSFTIPLGSVVHTEYGLLSPAIPGFVNTDTITGDVTFDGVFGLVLTVSGTCTIWEGARESRGRRYRDGDLLGWDAGHWYRVLAIGGVAYPADYEQTVFTVHVGADQFYAGSEFSINAVLSVQLATPSTNNGASGEANGQIFLILEGGTYTDSGGGADLTGITWTTILSQRLMLSPAIVLTPIKFHAIHPATGAITATVSFGAETESAVAAPAAGAAAFAVRLRLSQFDCDLDANPRGQLLVSMKGALASISPL